MSGLVRYEAGHLYDAPALLSGVPHNVYHGDRLTEGPALSRSIAHLLVSRSPLHAWCAHPKLGAWHEDGGGEGAATGGLLHALLFGGGQKIVAVDAKDWRTNAAREARDAAYADGALPVLAGKLEEVQATAGLLRRQLAETGIDLAAYAHEVTVLWREDGVLCRGRFDMLDLAGAAILDPKFVKNGNPSGFARAMLAYGYDMQYAAYTSALEILFPDLAGRVTMEFLLCEPHPPYTITRATAAGSMASLGQTKWSRAVRVWRQCLEESLWPGYSPDVVWPVEAPPWALQADFAAELQAAPEPDWMSS